MKLETAKGVRDFPPEEKIIRQQIIDKLITVFERYGYSPLETPIIERYEVLTAKFAAGEESDALKETFKFEDQGKRKLGLRFDLTVPLARFISMNPKIKMPFKRYEIGRTYRDGPIKLGRYREFWQCDVDVVGCKDMLADAEIIKLSLDVFKELGFDAYIELNNRKLLNGILEYADIPKQKREQAIIAIDKLKKLSLAEVKKELKKQGISDDSIKKVVDVLETKGTNEQILSKLKKIINNKIGLEGIEELEQIFYYLTPDETKDVKLNISLARGLAYYTGPVYEGFLRKSKISSSICGGGRYDDLIGLYLGGKEQYPATGISFGLEPITEAIKLTKEEMVKTVSQVYIIPIKTTKEALEIAQKLRKASIKTDIDLLGRGLSKNLDYADKLKIPYVIIVGPKDLEENQVTIRNMKTGKEEKVLIKNIVEYKF